MKIIANTLDIQVNRNTAVAIGKFDGLHVGHRKLLTLITEQKNRGLAPCVFTFDPSPAVLFGLSDGKELMTREEKRRAFEHLGVEILVEFPLTPETAAMAPEVFVKEILVKQLQTRYVAAGEDVSFGRCGKGNALLLKQLGNVYGYEVETIEKLKLYGREVSSTYVRSQVEAGEMERVTKLLGTPYTVSGSVCHGARLGRTLGMPTVNLLPPATKQLPPFGVYFSRVRHGDHVYAGISNIGCKPTVTDAGQIGVETYLYDFDAEIYGEEITVELLSFRRPEQKFPDVEALKAQVQRDIAAGRAYTEGHCV